MSVYEEYRTAQSVECAYVHRFLAELDRLEAGNGSETAYVLALELLRAAHLASEAKRSELMRAVA